MPVATALILVKSFSGFYERCDTTPFNERDVTSDSTAGLGARSDAEIIRAIGQGIARDGHPLKQPMAYGFYAGLKPADLADIIAYLRNVPPLQ